MYPQYYSHEHRRFELLGEDAVPIPTKTAVYGSLAKDLLVTRGSYPEDRIVITGSPKFDALVLAAEGFDRKKTRTALQVPEGARMLVLATRFTAVGAVFSDLVEAVERLENVWLFVKPHQAESPSPYEAILARVGAPQTRMLSSDKNLLELLFASDGLITVDSFASSEALVLGRPVLVVNLPNNLSALVERGVALGASSGASLEQVLRKLLFDDRARKELEEKRKEYIQEFAFGADGRSTERIVEAILATCKS
jgi:UDP-N-acetylglucosamine 2-epimerase